MNPNTEICKHCNKVLGEHKKFNGNMLTPIYFCNNSMESEKFTPLSTEEKKPDVIILDNNPLSLACFAEEYPEHWEKIKQSQSICLKSVDKPSDKVLLPNTFPSDGSTPIEKGMKHFKSNVFRTTPEGIKLVEEALQLVADETKKEYNTQLACIQRISKSRIDKVFQLRQEIERLKQDEIEWLEKAIYLLELASEQRFLKQRVEYDQLKERLSKLSEGR